MDDKSLRRRLRRVSLSGVAASGALMTLGLAAEAGGKGGTALIRAGILALITIPTVQVLVIASWCAVERDKKFFGVSMGLLALLGTGIWLGFH